MSRKGSSPLEYGIEEEVDPKLKFDSLISVTISTIMCLAAKCALPKSNVETTKLFLSKITDENGKTPRNIKDLLALLKNYSGPYETSPYKENKFEKHPTEKIIIEKEKKPALENDTVKSPPSHGLTRDISSPEGSIIPKRGSKASVKKNEKEQNKKVGKSLLAGSKCSPSKSTISSKM